MKKFDWEKKLPYRTTVRLGEHRLSTDPDCKDGLCNETPQDFDIEQNIFHEDYGKPVVFRNDIAILRLSRPVIKTGNCAFTF